MAETVPNNFVPALRYHWLTKVYDWVLKNTFPEKQIKEDVVQLAHLLPGQSILDFGVGTATLSIMAYKSQPTALYHGIDVDKAILEIADSKISSEKAAIELLQYDGKNLPYNDEAFDTIISSLVFHHLYTEGKAQALAELFRVLKHGGRLIIADFGKAKSVYTKIAFGLFRRFDGERNTRVNAQGLLSQYIQQAGFKSQEKKYYNTIVGTITLIEATKE